MRWNSVRTQAILSTAIVVSEGWQLNSHTSQSVKKKKQTTRSKF